MFEELQKLSLEQKTDFINSIFDMITALCQPYYVEDKQDRNVSIADGYIKVWQKLKKENEILKLENSKLTERLKELSKTNSHSILNQIKLILNDALDLIN